MGPVINQLTLGSCVSNANHDAIRTRAKILLANTGKAGSILLGSRLQTYWFIRFTYGEVDQDSGADNTTAIEVLTGLGFCAEGFWPYSDEQAATYDPSSPDPYRREPSTLSMEQATPHKQVLKANRIDSSSSDEYLLALRTSLATGYPVPFGAQVSQDFCQGNIDPTVPIPATVTSVGGHDMWFTGYETASNGQSAFRARTSWGVAPFGPGSEDGTFLVSEDFVTQSTSDAYAIVDVPILIDSTGSSKQQ